MYSNVLDLSKLNPEQTHELSLDLQEAPGTLQLLVVKSGIKSMEDNGNLHLWENAMPRYVSYWPERETETERGRGRETETKRQRETETERDRETETERDRETERQRDRQTDRQTERWEAGIGRKGKEEREKDRVSGGEEGEERYTANRNTIFNNLM